MKINLTVSFLNLYGLFIICSLISCSQTRRVSDIHSGKDGFTHLWDGKTLNGWRGLKSKDIIADWSISDGVLSLASTTKGASRGGDIVTEKEFGAFEFKFDFKISEAGNSGIKYFVTNKNDGTVASLGLEYQILDDEKHHDAKKGINGNRTLGSLYDLITSKKIPAAQKPIGQWNQGIIKVFPNNHVEHWLNGYKVLEFERGSATFLDLIAKSKYNTSSNFGMASKGRILLQDHGDDVSYRNLMIKELK